MSPLGADLGATDPDGNQSTGDLHLLSCLNEKLEPLQTEVEFYFVAGALIFQAFNALPHTAQISAQFRPGGIVRRAVSEVSGAEGAPPDWLQQCVRRLFGSAPSAAYVELSHVRLFVPVPDYVLAVKCAAMAVEDDDHDVEDIRFLLRAMNVESADQALSVVTRYFTERQLAPDTKARLQKLLAPQRWAE